MNFTSGATIYQEIHNIDQHLKDYYQHIVNIPVNSATRLLVDKEITVKQKQFDQCGKTLYVLKSDYEKDIREQNEHIKVLYEDLRLLMGEELFKEKYPHADMPF